MTSLPRLAPFTALAAAACITEPEGVYVVTIDATSGTECETEMSENYRDDEPPDGGGGDDEWVYEDLIESTGAAFYIELIPLVDGTWALNWQGRLLPGSQKDNVTWRFSWTDSTEDRSSAEHEDGYRYVEVTTHSETHDVDIVLDAKGLLSGTYAVTLVDEVRWRETDEWDPDDNDIGATQLPSADYLFDEDGDPVVNDPDDRDCDDDECFIVLTTTCDDEADFLATRTDPETTGDFLLPANASGSSI